MRCGRNEGSKQLREQSKTITTIEITIKGIISDLPIIVPSFPVIFELSTQQTEYEILADWLISENFDNHSYRYPSDQSKYTNYALPQISYAPG